MSNDFAVNPKPKIFELNYLFEAEGIRTSVLKNKKDIVIFTFSPLEIKPEEALEIKIKEGLKIEHRGGFYQVCQENMELD